MANSKGGMVLRKSSISRIFELFHIVAWLHLFFGVDNCSNQFCPPRSPLLAVAAFGVYSATRSRASPFSNQCSPSWRTLVIQVQGKEVAVVGGKQRDLRALSVGETEAEQSTVTEGESKDGLSFEDSVKQRYACTRYQPCSPDDTATQQRIKDASYILDLSRRAPTGFNVQPYRAILVSSPEAKNKLAKYCLGRNADRVRQSDCTAVFLADKECGRDLGRLGQSIRERDTKLVESDTTNKRSPMTNFALRKIQALVLLFSSGYPIPRFLAAPISFFVRLGVATVGVLTRRRVLVPSLGSAETWATKNTMLFAMSYMLGCTSRHLATCPMEGFNAGGIRKALNIPRRYAIPLIVSTGIPYRSDKADEDDDVGMSHGGLNGGLATARFPVNKVLYKDSFGQDWL